MVKRTVIKMLAVALALSLPTGFAWAAGAKSDKKIAGADEKFLKEPAKGEMMDLELRSGLESVRTHLQDSVNLVNLSMLVLVEWMSQLGAGQFFFVGEIETQRGH